MKRLAQVVVTLAIAAGAGCGGSKSCQDACNAVQSCATKLQAQAINVTACVQGCQAGTCQNKQAAIDCVAGLACPATVDAYNAGLTNCQNTTGCEIQIQ